MGRSGIYKTEVTSKVLDEGMDVPDTDVGVVLSDTGIERGLYPVVGQDYSKERWEGSRVV